MNDHGRDTDDAALEARVSSLLSAAAAPSEPGPLPGEGAALAAFRASRAPATRRSPLMSRITAARAGVAATLGAVLLTGGVAAAATGVLPGAAQDTVDTMLVELGVTVPGVDDASAGHPDDRGRSDVLPAESVGDEASEAHEAPDNADETTVGDGRDTTPGDTADAGKGDAVSGLATGTEAAGADKGAEISGLASEGRSRAGEQPPRATRPDAATGAKPDQAAEKSAGTAGAGDTRHDAATPRP